MTAKIDGKSLGDDLPDIPEIHDRNQLDFAVRMFHEYLRVHRINQTYERRVYYWITKMPHELRQIPTKSGKTRLFENTGYNWCRFSNLITKARMKGLINWDQVTDNKNPRLRVNTSRNYGSGKIEISQMNPYEISTIHLFEQENWETLVDEIEAKKSIIPPMFANQEYYLLIVIEKSTADAEIQRVANRYGCDYQIFKGQPSTTREHEAMVRAAAMRKARNVKETGKPMAIFYISDLDPAGQYMSDAYFNRIQEMYPNPEHKLIKVALNRGQVEEHDLPSDKITKYTKKAMDKFEAKTGGRTCVELDALETDDLCGYLEDAIKPYACLDDDKKQLEEMKAEWSEREREINEKIQDYLQSTSLDSLKARYEETEQELSDINDEIKKLNERLKDIHAIRQALQDDFNKSLLDALGHSDDESKIE